MFVCVCVRRRFSNLGKLLVSADHFCFRIVKGLVITSDIWVCARIPLEEAPRRIMDEDLRVATLRWPVVTSASSKEHSPIRGLKPAALEKHESHVTSSVTTGLDQ